MGFTAPCELEFVAMAMILPAVLVYYIMKTAHLIFIFQWTLAKSQDNMWQVNRFVRFRHFVSDQVSLVSTMLCSARSFLPSR